MTVSLSPIPTSLVGEAWTALGPLLAPAVAFDDNASLDDVREKLLSGQCEAAMVNADGTQGVIVTEICQLDGVKVCWLSYVAGSVGLTPRRWLAVMREGIGHVEALARSIGCHEVRIGGRDWSRILTDYQPFDDVPNRMRKVL